MKPFIPVLLGTSRIGRQSVQVARLLLSELQSRDVVNTELLDLADYRFPIMEQRMDHTDTFPAGLSEFSENLAAADGVMIVAPEYKNGYPGVLKNAFDYLAPQIFHRKPIGIATVSAGGFGGINCLSQLRLVCLALGGLPIPDALPVSRVGEAFDAKGELLDESLGKRLVPFVDELVWYTTALAHHRKECQR